jgi:hypothetical protein
MPGQDLACKCLAFKHLRKPEVLGVQALTQVKKNLSCDTRKRKRLRPNALRMQAQTLAPQRITPHPFECGAFVSV